ncbi:MAG TPA: MarR family transcriptional regulator [Syntrophomonas sp.]|nr:MarR family transcriptional regulator [Syntrophomonas sp.]
MQDFTTFICYRLKSTMKRVEKHIGATLENYGVTMAQSFILFSLLEKDGCTLTEIGNRAQIDNSSLTTMVDKLEKEGLVERRLFAQDRRVVNLYLTDRGRELGKTIYDSGAALNRELGEQLGNREDFYADLEGISNLLDQKRPEN